MRYPLIALSLALAPLQQAAGQVQNDVSQAGDLDSKSWAVSVMAGLVERHGCASGYPASTFRGNRPITRFEFAAALNACLDQWRVAIDANQMTLEDRGQVAELQREFASELATLGGRVNALESRTRPQFSPTQKLDQDTTQLEVGQQGLSTAPADRPVPKKRRRRPPTSTPAG